MDREAVVAYHEATKHHFHRYAPGPGQLDWATQPDPFRRYHGASLVALGGRQVERDGVTAEVAYQDVLQGRVPPAALDAASLSQFFRDSLALSAWKSFQGSRWSLRVNPSSGNLHPTEGYFVGPAVEGLLSSPCVAHYAPREHGLEVRTTLPAELFAKLQATSPTAVFFVGLTSILWREAWKYGERAYRYCHLDVGHALASLALAGALQGWEVRVLGCVSGRLLDALLGLEDPAGAEPERGDCLLAVGPGVGCGAAMPFWTAEFAVACKELAWHGIPNVLSRAHRAWPAAERMEAELRSPAVHPPRPITVPATAVPDLGPAALRELIHRRRSAVAFTAEGSLPLADFHACLRMTLPSVNPLLRQVLPGAAFVHLLLFVHRVDQLTPGVYLWPRQEGVAARMQSALRSGLRFAEVDGLAPLLQWIPEACGPAAKALSCHQDIAADGFFSLGMLTEFEAPLREHGAWYYPRLYWECGMVGQVLYLEAERLGLQGTGIGCFFDDAVHDLVGLKTREWQSLYHFTMGQPVVDPRLGSLPAYS